MRYGLPIFICCLLAGVATSSASAAENEASQFLYGTIETREGDSYTGPIRWDGEEVLWTDHFNAEKSGNEYLESLTPEDMQYLETRGPSRIRRVGDLIDLFSKQNRFSDFKQAHSFVCRFGDIARLEPIDGNQARLILRNGTAFVLRDNSNDLGAGTEVQIAVAGEDLKSIRWRNIASVEFAAAPTAIPLPWGRPLFGEVETAQGNFTGFIQWDHDERVSSEMLDGDSDNEELSIVFEDIAAIEKTKTGSKVFLHTEEAVELDGSNDVDRSNRGIYVELENSARVDVPWSEFRRVEFRPLTRMSPSYADFAAPRKLAGTVTGHKGDRHKGQIVFDLDEAWDIELLDGRQSGLRYMIPFSVVSQIRIIDVDSVRVQLRDDSQLVLAHEQDVSERNSGLIVFADGSKPHYLRWADTVLIDFTDR